MPKRKPIKKRKPKRNVITAGSLAIILPFEEIKLFQNLFYRKKPKRKGKKKK